VSSDYSADLLEQVVVQDRASRRLFVFSAESTVEAAREWLSSGAEGCDHQGYPLVNDAGHVVGLLTRRDLLAPGVMGPLRTLVKRSPAVVYGDSSLRQALQVMLRAEVGRLVVVDRSAPRAPIGILTRSDILGAHAAEPGPASFKRRPIVVVATPQVRAAAEG